jgi:hypothetical protein
MSLAVVGSRSYLSGDAAKAYVPATNMWTTRTIMSTPLAFLTAAVGSDGRTYAIGGYNEFLPKICIIPQTCVDTGGQNGLLLIARIAPVASPTLDNASGAAADRFVGLWTW